MTAPLSREEVEALLTSAASIVGAEISRYEHGGGRVWFQEEKSSGRDLVIDLYEPAERRDAILAILNSVDDLRATALSLYDRAEAAEARVRELEAALKDIAALNYDKYEYADAGALFMALDIKVSKARAALATKETADG